MVDSNSYKILHIFSSYGGGISSVVLNLIENKQEDFKFDIMAFSFENGDTFLKCIRMMGGEAYQMPRPRIDGYIKFKNFVDNVLSENRYDAVHCHITGWHAMPFVYSAKKHGINNFIFHAHTTKYDSRIDRIPFVQVFNKYLNYKHSVAYLTCSDMAANYIYGKKYLEKRVAYRISNGINDVKFSNKLSEAQKLAYHEEFHIPEGTIIIGHVGRFSTPKNHFFMLELINKLKQKNINFVLIFVGSGELFDSVKEKAHDEGLLANIRFLGRRTDISSLMQFFDCMILPSFYEGLPTVAVECQAAGTHMLLSDTITRQCDMNLDLLEFLPIDNITIWVNALERSFAYGHLDSHACIAQIRSLGFTATEAGKYYCNILKEIIAGERLTI